MQGDWPVKRTDVALLSTPLVPSYTCTTASSLDTSRTWPLRTSPSGRVIRAVSPKDTPFGLSTKIRGPET